MDHPRPTFGREWMIVIVGVVMMILCALLLDARVATAVDASHTNKLLKSTAWAKVLKAPGHFGLTAGVAAVLWFARRRWQPVAMLLAAGILSGLFYTIAKWIVGRTRPLKGVPPFELHPFVKGISGLWRAENMAFPSGHACLAFATAAALTLLYPAYGWIFYLLATVTGVERILEAAHYPSDVCAALVVGVLSAVAAWRLIERLDVRHRREPVPEDRSLVPGNS